MHTRNASSDESIESLRRAHEALVARGLDLDLTRGKPAAAQLDLSASLDGILQGDYRAEDGTDTRNYGGLDGIPEARRIGAHFLDCAPADILVGGNSSLTLMFTAVSAALGGPLPGTDAGWTESAARAGRPVRFLCPVPGYDRHFAICAHFGIEMTPVPMDDHGPDMDTVEALVREDPGIRGIWCVPRYSNPSGVTYSDEVVERIAALGRIAQPGFRVFWDNAYALHHFATPAGRLANVMARAVANDCADSVLCFASTSKVTFAGAGISFLAASEANREWIRRWLGVMTIGPDKVNQLRHARLLPDAAAIDALMARHAARIAPKFEAVESILQRDLGNTALARWTRPGGGYFVSLDTRPGLATEVVRLAGAAGVRLTPAGATWPGGHDPEDRNIRIAPTVPPLDDVRTAMEVLTLCVRLASAEADAAGS